MTDEITALAEEIRRLHLEIASYTVRVHCAEALAFDPDEIRRLRLTMERDAYALEQAVDALAQRLAETTAVR
jgi:lipase chaperone LimK